MNEKNSYSKSPSTEKKEIILKLSQYPNHTFVLRDGAVYYRTEDDFNEYRITNDKHLAEILACAWADFVDTNENQN
jgi:hypothetical protein